jgi:hypothetical protein
VTLSGSVTDDTGQAVGGAVVSILVGRDINQTAPTDASGRYTIAGLSAGVITILVQREGFDDHTRTVTLSSATSLDVTLVRARVNLAGPLTGTFSYTSLPTAQRVVWPMTATVTQVGTAIAGSFRIEALPGSPEFDWSGSFAGTLSRLTPTAEYSGSLTIRGLISTGNGRCNGTRSETTGSATTKQLTLSAPGLWRWTEYTSTRQDVVITLSRP